MRSIKRRPSPPTEQSGLESAGGMRWLLTYADMITLLLAFFIILYSLSNLQKTRYQALVHALHAAFNGRQVSVTQLHVQKHAPYAIKYPHSQSTPPPASSIPMQQLKPPTHLVQELKSVIAQDHLQESVKLSVLPYGVNLVFLNGILFAEGHASIDSKGIKPLHDIGAILSKIPNAVVVQGYTDNLPIDTSVYHSNWDLSAMRAARVADTWMNMGISPIRMTLEGFGQWSPFQSNSTQVGRALNRSVSVVILDQPLRLKDTVIGSPTMRGF